MASEITDRFQYSITHTYVTRRVGDSTQTKTLVGAEGRSLDRLADRTNERSEHCEQCGARVRVVLRSVAEVRRRRRAHRCCGRSGRCWPY